LGIGFAEGLTVFVALSAPGDRLRVAIKGVKKRIAFAEIVEIIELGPQRSTPPCPYFGTCGGCDFQQLSYEVQLEAKIAIIRDCLGRIGKIDYDSEIPIIGSPEPLGYRPRARWQIDRDNGSLAYFARDSHQLVPVKTCPKLVPELSDIVENFIPSDVEELGDELIAAAGDNGSVSMFSRGTREAPGEIAFTVGSETYAFSAETFFQANKFLVDELIDASLGDAKGKTAIDLYCGVGLFAVPLARRFGHVIAVEAHQKAASFAHKNLAAAGLTNVDVIKSTVSDFLTRNKHETVDFILLDPPRSGDDANVTKSIATLQPRRISYVSCDPAILARDLRTLIDAGYRIDKITALDMFPQTHHVETVVHMICG
jgi:23S rRNA (uracil1939-C5)-methyltransferase